MTIEEIIAKLPEEYQEIARTYTTLLLDMSFAELQTWVEMIAKGNWQNAYRNLVVKMSTEELLIAERKGHEILKRLNKENADSIATQFALIEQIILTSILMLRKEIEA